MEKNLFDEEETNAKIRKTKEKLRHGIIELLSSSSINEISVSSLCAKAEINRTTFYKYYKIPNDVLDELIVQSGKKVIKLLEQTRNERDPIKAFFDAYCRSAYEERETISVAFKQNSTWLWISSQSTKLLPKALGKLGNSKNSKAMMAFLSGGVLATFEVWCLEGFKQSPEQVSAFLTETVKKAVALNQKQTA